MCLLTSSCGFRIGERERERSYLKKIKSEGNTGRVKGQQNLQILRYNLEFYIHTNNKV